MSRSRQAFFSEQVLLYSWFHLTWNAPLEVYGLCGLVIIHWNRPSAQTIRFRWSVPSQVKSTVAQVSLHFLWDLPLWFMYSHSICTFRGRLWMMLCTHVYSWAPLGYWIDWTSDLGGCLEPMNVGMEIAMHVGPYAHIAPCWLKCIHPLIQPFLRVAEWLYIVLLWRKGWWVWVGCVC